MTVSIAPAQDDVLTALRSFILSLITCEVVQGLGNGVPMPLGGFIAITPLFQSRLSTNQSGYADPTPTTGTRTATQAVQATFQIDCYGPSSADWANIFSTAWRDDLAVSALSPVAAPMYCDDPKMIALTDGEQQYEQRWTITAALQCNPAITTPMQFFAQAQVSAINSIDAVYPP